jgi:hypothetical protein
LNNERLRIIDKLKNSNENDEMINKMGVTFKTDLDKRNMDNFSNNSKEIKEGFFNLKSFTGNNRLQSQTIQPNNTKKGFFNISNTGNEKPDKIKNFNTKGINMDSNNKESHLNIMLDNLSIKKVDDYLNLKEKTQENSNIIFKELFEIDNKMVIMKNNMSNLRRNEMNRLIKEFNMNDYERRFKTTRHKVISALIGEENTSMEMNRQNRENNVNNLYTILIVNYDKYLYKYI